MDELVRQHGKPASLAFSPDGHRMVVVFEDGAVYASLWEDRRRGAWGAWEPYGPEADKAAGLG